MAYRFWKSMPAALKRPTLDELYKRSRDLDHTQVDERLAVMLNAILQLEAQGDCRESGTEAVLIVGYTSEGISRNSGWSNNTEYGARQFPPPSDQTASRSRDSIHKQTTIDVPVATHGRVISRSQQHKERVGKANPEKDQAVLDGDQAKLDHDKAIFEQNKAILDQIC